MKYTLNKDENVHRFAIRMERKSEVMTGVRERERNREKERKREQQN